MIFITVGTQKFQMNRLLKELDKCIESKGIDEEVFAQIGNSTYVPKYYKYCKFLNKEEFDHMIEKCDLLITHSGVATIISGLKFQKPIIVVPRLEKYKEHVDDHQVQIADSFQELNYILKCENMNQLPELIQKAQITKFEKYVSNKTRFLEIIEMFINGMEE